MDNAATLSRGCPETADVLAWLFDYRRTIDCTVERIPFSSSRHWKFDSGQSALRHSSGRFFTVQGYKGVADNQPPIYQPLINQPETGTQGFIIRRGESGLELLAQARTEPGNVGIVQIGPTIQATFSNYTAVHQGKRQPFLKHFHHPELFGAGVVLDTVQPELGSRFLNKWNRNIVIETSSMTDFSDPMFKWVSLKTMTRLMQIDHIVNNDARLVVGLLALECGEELFRQCPTQLGQLVSHSFATAAGRTFLNVDDAREWVGHAKTHLRIEAQEVALEELPRWRISADEISHDDDLHFSVIQVAVHAADREVTDWDQPLIAADHTAEIILVCLEEQGVLNFLFRAEPQIGNANGAQLQPTFCFDNEGESSVPSGIAGLLNDQHIVERFTFEASDEGGRFYQCLSRYDIRWIDSDVHVDLPENFCWLTLAQIRALLNEPDFISDESRSILSLFLTAALSARFECERNPGVG